MIPSFSENPELYKQLLGYGALIFVNYYLGWRWQNPLFDWIGHIAGLMLLGTFFQNMQW